MLDKRKTLFKREMFTLSKEKTFLVAIIMQLVIASVSSFLVFGFVSMFDPSAGASQSTVNFAVSGSGADDMMAVIESDVEVSGTEYTSLNESLHAYDTGQVNGVLHIEKMESGKIYATLIAPDTGFESGLVVSKGKAMLQELQEQQRQDLQTDLQYKPLSSPSSGSSTPYFEFTYTVLVPVLIFLPVFITGSLVADSLSQEEREGTLEILQTTPLSNIQIFDGKLLSAVFLAPLQVGIWLALLYLNNIMVTNPLALLVLVTSFASIVGAVGAGIGSKFKERNKVQFYYSTSLLLLFSITVLLPEHPINTVAKLAMGSATTQTYIILTGYVITALAVVGVIRRIVSKNGFEK